MTTAQFFEPGKTYRHGNERGIEGIFDVCYVGTAPTPLEHHSEIPGIAFGWLWDLGPNGTWQRLSVYTTLNFADWEEIPVPPCGARVGNHVCVIAELPVEHGKHVTAAGDWWLQDDPCSHDDCQRMECDGEPTVYCGATSDTGRPCCFIVDHKRPHAYEKRQ